MNDTSPVLANILLVEDEANYREITERLYNLVRKAFHGEVSFLTADSWEAGMKVIASGHVDVMIVDLCLPPLSPKDTLKKIQSTLGLPPIVAFTGMEAIDNLREDCFAAGCDDVMFKSAFRHHPEGLCEKCYHSFLRHNRPCLKT